VLPIKTPGTMPLHVQKEVTHYNEINDKIFDLYIDINMWDIVRNVIELILFHLFHGQSNSTTYRVFHPEVSISTQDEQTSVLQPSLF
jgi:hypothetical protein